MKSKTLIGILSIILFFNSCKENEEPIICTANFVYGLQIYLVDKADSSAITGNAKILISDGHYSEILENLENGNSFYGAGERQGTYVLTVTSDNYKTFVSEPIVVTGDECHVITASKTIELELK